MNQVKVDDFLDSLNVKIPSFEKFQKLGDLTALYQDEKGNFIRLNYERGPLLYALISKYKPKKVFEIGTARGYSTLCMAWSMTDNNIHGKIYTIDMRSITISTEMPIDWGTGKGPTIIHLPVSKLWSKIAPKEWLDHIEFVEGFSGEALEKKSLSNFDFAFIDGTHFYEGVKHDFFSFLNIASDRFGVLFDDYISRPQYGVKKLIDEVVEGNFDTYLIQTDKQKDIMRLNMTLDPKYGMCWIHSNSLKKPLNEVYSEKEVSEFLLKYRNYEKRLKIRYKLNETLPFLKNIRFRWWKK